MQDITIICNIYDLHVLIEINYINHHILYNEVLLVYII